MLVTDIITKQTNKFFPQMYMKFLEFTLKNRQHSFWKNFK